MITLFTTFRSFEDPVYSKIQNNAVQSWGKIKPFISEFFVYGDDFGVKDLCEQNNFTYLPNIQKDHKNTPYLNDMLQETERLTKNDLILLISGDIIVSQERFESCIKLIQNKFDQFCICSAKVHISTEEEIDFEKDWEKDLTSNAFDFHAGDFFLFNKGFFGQIPNFLVGRCRADRWLFKYAISKNVLIDATDTIKIYHHRHHYNWNYNENDESYKYNAELYDNNGIEIEGVEKYVSIFDANYKIDKSLNVSFIR